MPHSAVPWLKQAKADLASTGYSRFISVFEAFVKAQISNSTAPALDALQAYVVSEGDAVVRKLRDHNKGLIAENERLQAVIVDAWNEIPEGFRYGSRESLPEVIHRLAISPSLVDVSTAAAELGFDLGQFTGERGEKLDKWTADRLRTSAPSKLDGTKLTPSPVEVTIQLQGEGADDIF